MEIFAIAFLVVQGMLAVLVLVLNRAATRNWQISIMHRRKAGAFATAMVKEDFLEQKYNEDAPFRKAA